MAVDHSAVLAGALDETLQNFAGTEALTEDARHTLFTDFTQKLRELGAEAAMYDVIESSVPNLAVEPSWDATWETRDHREQAQALMNEAADVMVPEEKDPHVLRAIAYLLMSIDDRLGVMQDPPRRPSFLEKRPDSTDWAVGDAVLVPGREQGQLAQIGQIDQLHYPFGAQAGGIAQIVLANGETGCWPIDALLPAPPRGPGSTYMPADQWLDTIARNDEGLLTEYRWTVGDWAITPAGSIGEITRISEGTPATGISTFADIRTERGHQLHIRIEKLRPAPAPLDDDVLDALVGAVQAMESVATGSALATPDMVLLTEQAQLCRGALTRRGAQQRLEDPPRIDPITDAIGVHNAVVALRLAAEALEYIAPKSGVGDRSMLTERAATCRRALITQ